MPLRSVIDIEVNDAEWRKFTDAFKDHQDGLSDTAKFWKQIAELQPRIRVSVEKQTGMWHRLAHDSKTFASNIASATTSLLRWASLTGVISGLVGFGGGLFGLERLASSAGNQRRSALGLGVTSGQRKAVQTELSRVVDPDAVMSGVNGALTDVTRSMPLRLLGLDYNREQHKGTFEATLDAFQKFAELARRTPQGQLGSTFQRYRLGELGFQQDQFQALHTMSADEVEKMLRRTRGDVGKLNVPDGQLRAWQDFEVALRRAGAQIEQTLIKKLAPLAPSLSALSTSLSQALDAFLGVLPLKKWLAEASEEIRRFADYMRSPEFTRDLASFGTAVEKFVDDVDRLLPELVKLAQAAAEALRIVGNVLGPWVYGRAPDPEHPLPNDPPVQREAPRSVPEFDWRKPWTYDLLDRLRGTHSQDETKQAPSPERGGSDRERTPFIPTAYRQPATPNTPRALGDGPGLLTFTGPTILSFSRWPMISAPVPSGGAETSTGEGQPQVTDAAFRTPMPSADTRDRAGQAYDFFRAQGWSEAQTAGILGNLATESRFDPQAFNPAGGGQGAMGIAQWRGDRIEQFKALFGHDPLHGTFEEQLQFVQWELTHNYRSVGEALRKVGDAARAAALVNERYEVSGQSSAGRSAAAVAFSRNPPRAQVQVKVENATGGNANATVAQLAV